MELTIDELNEEFNKTLQEIQKLNNNDTICTEEKEYKDLVLQVKLKEIIFNISVFNNSSKALINALRVDLLNTQELLINKEIELGIHLPIPGMTRTYKSPLYEIKVD